MHSISVGYNDFYKSKYSKSVILAKCIQYVYMGFSRSLCSSNIFLKEPALGSRFSFKFVMNDDDKIGSP